MVNRIVSLISLSVFSFRLLSLCGLVCLGTWAHIYWLASVDLYWLYPLGICSNWWLVSLSDAWCSGYIVTILTLLRTMHVVFYQHRKYLLNEWIWPFTNFENSPDFPVKINCFILVKRAPLVLLICENTYHSLSFRLCVSYIFFLL